MRMAPMTTVVRNQKGLAMVLAVSLIGLLTSLGVYLLLESNTGFRITKALGRHETALNLAEGGMNLGLRCIAISSPAVTYQELENPDAPAPITTGLPAFMAPQIVGNDTVVPLLDYVGYTNTPPAGWMINWQGSSAYYSVFYRAQGQGTIPLTTARGSATSTVSALSQKVMR